MKRVDEAITAPYEESILHETPVIYQEKGLDFENVCVSWQKKSLNYEIEGSKNVLKNVSFSFKKNDKVAVVGRVGTGKTSLLLSILGELQTVEGEIRHSKNVSFAEQTPLIVTGTVRSNILFGLPFDKNHYDKVVNACCLGEDFKALPKGDETKLGEMGHILSGG